jgi:hypothetical protein
MQAMRCGAKVVGAAKIMTWCGFRHSLCAVIASFTYRENGNNEQKPVCSLGGCVGLALQINVEQSGLAVCRYSGTYMSFIPNL